MYITMVYILTEENAMDNSEKTLDQLVALCKGRGFVYPGSEITAVLQIHGTTVRSALNLRKTSKKLGERNLSRKTNTM